MRLKNTLLVLTSMVLCACMTVQTTLPGTIGVSRKQSFLVSAQQVEAGSVQAYQQIVKDGAAKGGLNTDAAKVQRVRAIANRLIPQTMVFRADAANWNWEINVLTENTVNAFCMPGGKIVVYTGLIDRLNVTDAELAAVMGHEIAHALREHGREKLTNSVLQQVALVGFVTATGAGESTVQLANMVSQVTFTLPNSREMETEADHIGLELMARAGFDPNAAVTLFRKMERESPGSGPAFLSTHPMSEARAKDLQAIIPQVLPLYQQAAR